MPDRLRLPLTLLSEVAQWLLQPENVAVLTAAVSACVALAHRAHDLRARLRRRVSKRARARLTAHAHRGRRMSAHSSPPHPSPLTALHSLRVL